MILGVTPARGGSKGVPRKNIREISGKPLLAWTIEAAQRSNLLDDYVVSTEDPEIASVATRCGAKVVDRPQELATDESDTFDVLRHIVQTIDADVIVLLQATSPIRDDDLIDKCVDRFLQVKADSLATGFLCKFVEYGKNILRRQDIDGFFYDDGNVYVMDADMLRRGERYGQRIEKVHLDREQNIEIDDEFDFWLAEQILTRRISG